MGIEERKKREKELRRESIINASEKVFFEKGFEMASMDEVAKVAELSKGTIYLYFKNKIDLYHAVVSRGLTILYSMLKEAAAKEEKGNKKIYAIGRAYFEFYKNHPDYFVAINHREKISKEEGNFEELPNCLKCFEIADQLFNFLQELVKKGIEDGTIRSSLDPLKLSIVLWAHSNGIMQLISEKEILFEKMFGIQSDEIYNYSFQQIKYYLENKK